MSIKTEQTKLCSVLMQSTTLHMLSETSLTRFKLVVVVIVVVVVVVVMRPGPWDLCVMLNPCALLNPWLALYTLVQNNVLSGLLHAHIKDATHINSAFHHFWSAWLGLRLCRVSGNILWSVWQVMLYSSGIGLVEELYISFNFSWLCGSNKLL